MEENLTNRKTTNLTNTTTTTLGEWVDETFTYKDKDYVDADHNSTILLTQKCVEDNKLSDYVELIAEVCDEEQIEMFMEHVDNTYTHIFYITNCTTKEEPYSNEFHGNDKFEEEVTLAFNELPIDLISKEGCYVSDWFSG